MEVEAAFVPHDVGRGAGSLGRHGCSGPGATHKRKKRGQKGMHQLVYIVLERERGWVGVGW